MNRIQLLTLHKKGTIKIPRSVFPNELPSDTDPTQNTPVQRIYRAMVSGEPIDVRQNKMCFSNVHADQLTAIDKRNTDAFDAFAELRQHKKTITTSVGLIDKRQKKLLQQIQNEKENEN